MKTKRNLWPYGIILTFLLFFAGMATVVIIASTHRDHLVNNNYYEQELKFQSQIDATSRAAKSGATISHNTAAGKVVVALPAAQLSEKFSGTVEFYRPSAPELDQELTLKPEADGRQAINVSKLAAGPWLVRVQWSAGGETYFLEQKIKI